MSVPTWLTQATPNSNGENFSQNPAGAPSLSFSRPPSAASLDSSHPQYQQMQLRMQNDTMRHGPPSSQSQMFNTQNIVPSKRSRPREGSIAALPPSYPSGTPPHRLQTLQGTYQGFQGAVHGGPQFRGPASYQHFQQQNLNSNQSPMMQHQSFNSQGLSPAVHRPPPSPFSPTVQGPGAPNTNPQPEHISVANTTQGDGQTYPPYVTSQGLAQPTNNTTNITTNHIPVAQFSNLQTLNPQQQRTLFEARARQMRLSQSFAQLRGVNMPQRQPNPSSNPMSHPINTIKNNRTARMQRRHRARANMIQARARPNHLDRLLRHMVQYMHSRKLPFNPRPVIAAKRISCVPIFLFGMKLGGSKKIHRLAQWPKIARLLSVPQPNIMAAGQGIRAYWENNLLQWERHFTQLQKSDSPHQRYQRQSADRSQPPSHRQQERKITRKHLRGMNHLQNANASLAQKPQAPQGQRPNQHSGRLQTPKDLNFSAQHVSNKGTSDGLKMQQKLYLQGKQSNIQGPRVSAKQQKSHSFRMLRSLARPKSIDVISNDMSKDAVLKNNFKATFLEMLAEGAVRRQRARLIVPRIKSKDTAFQELKSKDTFLKMIAEGAFRKNMAYHTSKKRPRKRTAEDAFPKTTVAVEDDVRQMKATGRSPKTTIKKVSRKVMRKKNLPQLKIVAKDIPPKSKAKDPLPRLKANHPRPNATAMATLLKMLPSPHPLMSFYTPRVHALDPLICKPRGFGDVRRNSPSTKAPSIVGKENNAVDKQFRAEYHGGLPVSNIWFKDTMDVLVKYKHSTPQLNELGVIDIQALVLSMKSGIHGEVRLALDVIAALSNAGPPPLRECEELMDTLIDFASDQIEILADGSAKSSNVPQLLSHQEQIRGLQKQSYILQEIPDIGSSSYDLSRAANRLVSVTTILRNLSLRPDNRESLREPSIIRMITTVLRYLGTRHLFLRTYQNTLDFSKDIVTFLSALSPYINLTSKEEGLAIIQFLLSFAPEPRPKFQGDKISFAFYVPTMHRYLPHAVNALAKLIARDPNRALCRSVFASESTSSPPFDLLTRAFGLAVSIIPEVAPHQGQGKAIIAVRNPIIAQGLLSADILVGMLPTSAHDIAYSWLRSQDGFVSRLMALLSLISTTPMIESRRRPDGRLRTAFNLQLGNRMISARGLALLRNLAEKAQDATDFATDFSPDAFHLRQSISRALKSNKEA